MPDTHPRLVAVPEEPEVPAGAEPGTTPERRGRRPLLWILAAALVLCALGWFFQAREARELAASLEATRTALGLAQAELWTYDRHLAEVGDQVGVLRGHLESLEALVEEGPRRSQEP